MCYDTVLIQMSDLLIDGDTSRQAMTARLIDLVAELLKLRNKFLHAHNSELERTAGQKVINDVSRC